MNQEGSDSEILVVGICGSLRSGSYTRMAVDVALRGAQDIGAQTQMIDLRDYKMTFCDGRKKDDTLLPSLCTVSGIHGLGEPTGSVPAIHLHAASTARVLRLEAQ